MCSWPIDIDFAKFYLATSEGYFTSCPFHLKSCILVGNPKNFSFNQNPPWHFLLHVPEDLFGLVLSPCSTRGLIKTTIICQGVSQVKFHVEKIICTAGEEIPVIYFHYGGIVDRPGWFPRKPTKRHNQGNLLGLKTVNIHPRSKLLQLIRLTGFFSSFFISIGIILLSRSLPTLRGEENSLPIGCNSLLRSDCSPPPSNNMYTYSISN